MIRVPVTRRPRQPGPLFASSELPDPAAEALPVEGAWIVGGEPTLRSDLPALLARSGRLVTDGLALASPGVVEQLKRAGLRELGVQLHSSQPDAHDWLVGRPGAFRLVLKALRLASELPLHLEVTLSRPALDRLPELVELGRGLGAYALRVWPAPGLLAPPLGLLREPAARAAAVASRLRVDLQFHGFPRCVAPGALPRPGEVGPLAAPAPEHEPGCAACDCPGLERGYAELFGRAELDLPRPHADELWVELVGPTRELKQRLVLIGGMRPRALRLVGAFEHPAALDLIADALRLGIPEVIVVGDASAASAMAPANLERVRGLAAVEVRGGEDALAALGVAVRAPPASLPGDGVGPGGRRVSGGGKSS